MLADAKIYKYRLSDVRFLISKIKMLNMTTLSTSPVAEIDLSMTLKVIEKS